MSGVEGKLTRQINLGPDGNNLASDDVFKVFYERRV